MMNKNEVLFTNAIYIKSVPEILPLMAVFSGLDEAISEAMTSFVKLFNSEADDVVIENIFDDQMSDFTLDILAQIKSSFPLMIKQYKTHIAGIEGIENANSLSNKIHSQHPYLTPLNEELSAKDILAYCSLIKDSPENLVTDFIEIFTPLVNLIQSDIDAKEQAKIELSNNVETSIIDGNLELLKEYVNDGFDLDCIFPSNNSPLIRAIEYKSYDILNYLIESNTAPYSEKSAHSGVDYCLITQDAKALTMLTQAKHPSLAVCNWQGILQNNLKGLNLALCIALFENIKEEVDFAQLIHQAFNVNNLEVLDYLLAKTDDPNSKYFHSPTILTAVLEENIPALTLFIKHGGNVNLLDFFENSILVKAIEEELTLSINTLLANNAKLICRESNDAYEFLLALSTLTNTPVITLIKNDVIEVNLIFIIGVIRASDISLLTALKAEVLQCIESNEQILLHSKDFETFEFLASLTQISEALLLNAEQFILSNYSEDIVSAVENRSIDNLLTLTNKHPELAILKFCLLSLYTQKNDINAISQLTSPLAQLPYRYLTWQKETLKWQAHWADYNLQKELTEIEYKIHHKKYDDALNQITQAIQHSDAIELKIKLLNIYACTCQFTEFNTLQNTLIKVEGYSDLTSDIQAIESDLQFAIHSKAEQIEETFFQNIDICKKHINNQAWEAAREHLNYAIQVKQERDALNPVINEYTIELTSIPPDLQKKYNEIEASLLAAIDNAAQEKIKRCKQAIEASKFNVTFKRYDESIIVLKNEISTNDSIALLFELLDVYSLCEHSEYDTLLVKVRKTIEQESDINRIEELKKRLPENKANKDELFLQAMTHNNIDTIASLIDDGLAIHDWEEVFCQYISTLDQNMTTYLLSKMDPDAIDDEILNEAIKVNNKAALSTLMSTCETDRFKGYVYDILVDLAEEDEVESFILLIQCGADVHFQNEHEDLSLLAKIIENDLENPQCIQYLYENKATIAASLKREYYDFCKTLCDRLTDVSFEDILVSGTMNHDLPALFYYAVEETNYEYVQTMLDHKMIEVNAPIDELSEHILDVALDKKMLTLLQSFGAKKKLYQSV